MGKNTSCDKDNCILEGKEVGKQVSREWGISRNLDYNWESFPKLTQRSLGERADLDGKREKLREGSVNPGTDGQLVPRKQWEWGSKKQRWIKNAVAWNQVIWQIVGLKIATWMLLFWFPITVQTAVSNVLFPLRVRFHNSPYTFH